MSQKDASGSGAARAPWWRSIGPALITACVVFGPGSLVISANVGATYRFELLWLLALAGLLMGAFMTMSARAGVTAGATHFSTIAREIGRPFAALLGAVLCLTCAAFQFSNNLAIALAVGAFAPEGYVLPVQLAAMAAINVVLVVFLFKAQHIFKSIEGIMKVMVGVVLISFLINLFVARPDWMAVVRGLVPRRPEGLS
ncbi:MAG TPA: Nramp family divalent metal transporter, partial [Candidatus Hydrogenedentes bacterium]|nr:Nramp family divalent metal transporter [Candidatus Hydrogenedentota bacterium]